MFVDSSLITGDECNGKRKRKREKLDHLTEEEKMMRRKIKNRLSAQTSRDKKKRVMSTLEIELASLGAVNKRLMQENGDLKKMLDQSESNQQRILSLEMENKFLKEKLDNLEKMIMNNNNNQKSSKSISDIDSSQSERSLDTSFEPAEEPRGKQDLDDLDKTINYFINCDGEDIISWLSSSSNQFYQNNNLLSNDSGIEDGSQSSGTFSRLFPKTEETEGDKKTMASIRDLITFDHMYHRNKSQSVEISSIIPNDINSLTINTNVNTKQTEIPTTTNSISSISTSTISSLSNQSLLQPDDYDDDNFFSSDLPMETIFFDDLFPELG